MAASLRPYAIAAAKEVQSIMTDWKWDGSARTPQPSRVAQD